MICPSCNNSDNRVLETRMTKEGELRRRRQCANCQSRFTTIETVMMSFPFVAKKDGRREPFSKEKLKNGLRLACMKRPVSMEQIDHIVNKVANMLLSKNEKEIGTFTVGQAVMEELKSIDDVAYVRFASVYRNFKDVHDFVQTLELEVNK